MRKLRLFRVNVCAVKCKCLKLIKSFFLNFPVILVVALKEEYRVWLHSSIGGLLRGSWGYILHDQCLGQMISARDRLSVC